jgi:hypothetical protein
MIIKPSIGRVVWYHPIDSEFRAVIEGQPHAAIVCGVWGDRMVNLAVHDANGNPYVKHSVTLHQDGDQEPASWEGIAQWMPFQVGQAKQLAAA